MTVYVGALSPQAFETRVSAGGSGQDLSTATAISFKVQKPSGAQQVWTGVIASATAKLLVANHPYLAGELDEAGSYIIVPTLTFPSGPWNCDAVKLPVKNPFA